MSGKSDMSSATPPLKLDPGATGLLTTTAGDTKESWLATREKAVWRHEKAGRGDEAADWPRTGHGLAACGGDEAGGDEAAGWRIGQIQFRGGRKTSGAATLPAAN